ncbi:hypothetical protein LCGC14_0249200 [marine sediment metagenome]|uniref:Uncharacterized protein n=1 Tax=marine sediment metagenome TaxID=412755 RepID=A0A0F9ULN0_9ZZZZ
MNALAKAYDRSLSVTQQARQTALDLKAAGIDLSPSGMGGMDTFRSQRGDKERYAQFRGWLYAAINALAKEAAGQPVNVGKLLDVEPENGERKTPTSSKQFHRNKMLEGAHTKTAGRDFEVLVSHPLIDVLEKPNPIQYRYQFVYSFVANLLLTGWSYIIIDTDKDGNLQFFSIPSTWVQPIHKPEPFSAFKIVNPKNPAASTNAKPIPRENVAFACLPDPSSPLGALAPAASQMNAIKIDNHIQSSQNVFFENSIHPSAIISIGNDPHPDVPSGVRPRLTGVQRRQVIGVIKRAWAGVANYGEPAIIDGLIEGIQMLSANSTEMGWDKSERSVKMRILSAFGVHESILGETVKVGGHAQAFVIDRRFCKNVNVNLNLLGTVLTESVNFHSEEAVKLLVWWEKCTAEDESLRQKSLIEARKNEDITRNEYRAELGFPPLEDQDERSKLLESAGGLTVTLTTLKEVGLGTVGREQAAKLLALFLQISEEQAKELTGVGEVSLPEVIEELSAVLEEMKKPIKVDFDDEELQGILKQLTRTSSRSSMTAESAKFVAEETEGRVIKLETALQIERSERKCDGRLMLEGAKSDITKSQVETVKAFQELGKSMADNQSTENQLKLVHKFLDSFSESVKGSLESIDKQSAQPITINVPVTVEPTPIEIGVENKVEPAEVKITNEVKTPNVSVPVTVQPSEVITPIIVEPTSVQIENKIETPKVIVKSEPQIDITVPKIPAAEVEVKVNVTRDDAPKRATIIHPDQRQSQVILED